MAKLRITLACGDYDRTRALQEGAVQPEGVELNVLNLGPEEIFYRMTRFREFDASEFSLSIYNLLGGREGPFVAIPVFLSRRFRHSCIFVHRDAGIREPGDLRGKRVGVPKYYMTAAVWIRGILEDEYGVAPKDLHWFEGGQPKEFAEIGPPADVRVETIPGGRHVADMLEAGELDGLVTARRPATFGSNSSPIRRLFPDPREVERAYYQKTGIFPIMHMIAIRRELVHENPWLPRSLFTAFVEAKRMAYERLTETAVLLTALPWLVEEAEATRALMGEDPFPYGVALNRKALETLARYEFDQGLVRRRLPVDELFSESTLDT